MNIKGARIAITGAGGFIGHSLIPILKNQGALIDVIGRGQIEPYLKKESPDFFIHLAGAVDPGRHLAGFESQCEDTVLPSIQVARNLKSSCKLAVFMGAFADYGNGPVPFREDQDPIVFSPYGWGKIASKLAVDWIAQERSLSTVWLRPSVVFGPFQKPNMLIPRVISGCLKDEEISLTPGEQTRDFLYVEDLCQIMATVMARALDRPAGDSANDVRGQILNICSGEERTVKDVAQQIQKKIGKGKLKFGAESYRSNEAMRYVGSTQKLNAFLGEPVSKRLTSFDEALSRTIAAFGGSHS